MAVYFTPTEQTLFAALDAEMQEVIADEVEAETIEAFEDTHQMSFRLQMLDGEAFPEVKELYDLVQQGIENDNLDAVDFMTLSPEALDIFFSCLGANGVSAMIEFGLQSVESKEDIGAIGALSRIRHGLLLSNHEFFATA